MMREERGKRHKLSQRRNAAEQLLNTNIKVSISPGLETDCETEHRGLRSPPLTASMFQSMKFVTERMLRI